MRILKSLTFVAILFFAVVSGKAQTVRPELLQSRWKAQWIAVPNEPAHGYGVYHFRKELVLPDKPASFVVHVSADNRYKLFVNEKLVPV